MITPFLLTVLLAYMPVELESERGQYIVVIDEIAYRQCVKRPLLYVRASLSGVS